MRGDWIDERRLWTDPRRVRARQGQAVASTPEAHPGDRRRRPEREDRRRGHRGPDQARSGQGPSDGRPRRREGLRPRRHARRHRRRARPRPGRRGRRRRGWRRPERPSQPLPRHRHQRQVHAPGHEGSRQGQERPLHPVRGGLVPLDRDDRAGRRVREGAPHPQHAARSDGVRADGARRAGRRGARWHRGRRGLRGRGPGGARRGRGRPRSPLPRRSPPLRRLPRRTTCPSWSASGRRRARRLPRPGSRPTRPWPMPTSRRSGARSTTGTWCPRPMWGPGRCRRPTRRAATGRAS